MRFKKGSKVEVLSKHEVPSDSWRCAEIVCGDGCNYTVRYDMGSIDEAVFEEVSWKLIRPCPPLIIFENWIAGDVVEVLHNYSWKMATVSKVLRGNHFMVRLLGSSNKFKICKFDIRVRQSWIHGKWILVGKGSVNHDEQIFNERSSMLCHWASVSQIKHLKENIDSHDKKDYVGHQNNINFQESCVVFPRNLKRGSPYCYSEVRAHEGILKFRLIEKDGRYHQVAVDPSPVPGKVDNYVCTREMLGQKVTYPVLHNGKKHFLEMNEERMGGYGIIRNSFARSLEHDGADTSSVGSCSIGSSNPFQGPSRVLASPAEDHSSAAESICQLHNEEGNCLVPNEEELAAAIHRLELHAYRCTMEALHASGPLSWEQETLITNLRISLHISNDEHLIELRNLISNATSIPIC